MTTTNDMNDRAEQLVRSCERMARELELDLTITADGPGLVVGDGQYLWAADPDEMYDALSAMLNGNASFHSQASAYEELCNRVEDLARRDSDRFHVIVAAWRERCEAAGNWAEHVHEDHPALGGSDSKITF